MVVVLKWPLRTCSHSEGFCDTFQKHGRKPDRVMLLRSYAPTLKAQGKDPASHSDFTQERATGNETHSNWVGGFLSVIRASLADGR